MGASGKIRAAALAALLVVAFAPPVWGDVMLAINNRTCALLTVELPEADGCGPDSGSCVTEAKSGTTRLLVRQPGNDSFIKLAAAGECATRSTALKGSCVVKIRKLSRLEEAPSAINEPLAKRMVAVNAPATLVAIELTQGICDTEAGMRKCALACQARDQQ